MGLETEADLGGAECSFTAAILAVEGKKRQLPEFCSALIGAIYMRWMVWRRTPFYSYIIFFVYRIGQDRPLH